MKCLVLLLFLAGCADVPDKPAARLPRYQCPELPLMRVDQTPRQYALMVVQMYNDCRDSLR
jgi:hypothetical protein